MWAQNIGIDLATPKSAASVWQRDRVSATGNGSEDQTSTTESSGPGRGEFLQLLVVQLQNQDPLSPVQNTEFVAQLATFSSLDQLVAIRAALENQSQTSSTVS